jgi:hypothetical protein
MVQNVHVEMVNSATMMLEPTLEPVSLVQTLDQLLIAQHLVFQILELLNASYVFLLHQHLLKQKALLLTEANAQAGKNVIVPAAPTVLVETASQTMGHASFPMVMEHQ